VIEVADILRAHAQQLHPSLSAAQQRVVRDLMACRTAALGGQVWACDRCGTRQYSYHSCRNRHCPKCHGQQTARWLEKQRSRLLPCDYWLLTFTLPGALRPLARAQPRIVYGLLMSCAFAALAKLAHDPRYVGAQLGALAVLHTWTRSLLYHPHIHLVVPSGGLSADGARWCPPQNPAYLVPVRALSVLLRAKLRAALRQAGLLGSVPSSVWAKTKPWVVHCQHAGRGDKVIEYLARYVFRVAIANSRIESFEQGEVTFRYRDNRTHQMQHGTLPAAQFLDRFLRHVLPDHFVKVRHYGFLAPAAKEKLARVHALLPAPTTAPEEASVSASDASSGPASTPSEPRRCPQCGLGHLVLVEELPRNRAPP
jgi:hypothetical protein